MLKTQLLYTAHMTIIFDDTLKYEVNFSDLDNAIDVAKLYIATYNFGEALIIDSNSGEILVHIYQD